MTNQSWKRYSTATPLKHLVPERIRSDQPYADEFENTLQQLNLVDLSQPEIPVVGTAFRLARTPQHYPARAVYRLTLKSAYPSQDYTANQLYILEDNHFYRDTDWYHQFEPTNWFEKETPAARPPSTPVQEQQPVHVQKMKEVVMQQSFDAEFAAVAAEHATELYRAALHVTNSMKLMADPGGDWRREVWKKCGPEVLTCALELLALVHTIRQEALRALDQGE